MTTTVPEKPPTDTRWRIAELFGPTIQGEGLMLGMPSVFVRFGGCDYRCSWCDSMHAVLPEYRQEWGWMSAEGILDAIGHRTHGEPILVVLSGGNPALYSLTPLIVLGSALGHRFSCETQGTRWPDWFRLLNLLTLSPKPPSSGETPDLDAFVAEIGALVSGGFTSFEVKVPIFDSADLDWFGTLGARLQSALPALALPLSISVGNPHYGDDTGSVRSLEGHAAALLDRYRWLCSEVIARRWFGVRVLPQMHVLAWGNRKGV
jgi:7-carboxy-7-deazaguanine synthase